MNVLPYLKVIWVAGGVTFFPLNFWSVAEVEDSINPDDVAEVQYVKMGAVEVDIENEMSGEDA